MLGHEDTLRLIREAQNGSESAKSTLLENNYPLIKSVIRRFKNKGIEYEDLYQLGCVGFLKAIKNFNEEFNVKFSTYIVPMVAGEVKRFMRDDGAVKVSRALKGLYYNIVKLMNEYRQFNNGQSPTVEYLAKSLNVDEQEIVMAMESSRTLISLNEKFDEDESNSCSIIDRVKVEEDTYENVDYILLKQALAELDERERKVIMLRYFRNKTQSEVANELGVSQVQVSRLESKILTKMRKKIE